MSAIVPDSQLLLLSIALSTIAYIVIGFISPRDSPVPLLVSVFLFTNMISRTAFFKDFVSKAQLALAEGQILSLWNSRKPLNSSIEGSSFATLSRTSQLELLQAIRSLEDYATNSRKTNDRRRSLYRMMSWRQQKLCDEAGYSRKLKRIDAGITQNSAMFNAIAEAAKKKYGVTYRDLGELSRQKALKSTSSSNYRVVESMGHFIRDWANSSETEPLLEYVKKQLDKIITPEQISKTCIIIPGSGLGRVAHEVAKYQKYGAVHAVEFSGLMHCCNQFIYSNCENDKFSIVPYTNSTSNFLTAEAQFREVVVPTNIPKPTNLHLHLDDFCAFEVPQAENYENVVVISVFFIDTAENILDYFDQINLLSAPSRHSNIKNGYWINVGPLKYGSAARAELNGNEIAAIRKLMGWRDIETSNTLQTKELFPYITDKQSLWQGFYGVTKWSSAHRDNARRIAAKE